MPIPSALIRGIDSLDPLPATVQRLMALMRDDDVALKSVVEVVENDESIVAQVMRVANSPIFRGRFSVDDLHTALVRLGLDSLMEIALGRYLRNKDWKAPLFELSENDLWLHGATCAQAVREIIAESSFEIPSLASVAALVHDIGKLVMSRHLDAEAGTIRATSERLEISLAEAERELFGCDHAEVGEVIARAWSFPESVVEAVARHHQVPLEQPTLITDAVAVANFVSKTVGVEPGTAGMNLQVDPECLRRLGISSQGFAQVRARTAVSARELQAACGGSPTDTPAAPRA